MRTVKPHLGLNGNMMGRIRIAGGGGVVVEWAGESGLTDHVTGIDSATDS